MVAVTVVPAVSTAFPPTSCTETEGAVVKLAPERVPTARVESSSLLAGPASNETVWVALVKPGEEYVNV